MPISRLIEHLRSEGTHEIYPVAQDQEIVTTESVLGKSLPRSFHAFLTQFSNGAYLFELQEVSSVGAGNPQISAIQNVISDAIPAEPDTNLTVDSGGSLKAGSLIPFSLDHNGNCWCFLTEQSLPDNEYPVAYYATNRNKLYGRLPGFEAWLEKLVEAKDEVIRTLYDEDTLYDELELG